MTTKNKNYLLGIFDNEATVLKTTKTIIENKIPIYDVYTPYPVHGLDDAMQIKRSRLPIVTFFAALLGFMCAMIFQVWVMSIDWPIIVGGKPFNAVPAFVPITFEMTVLFGGLVTVAVFFYRNKLFPGTTPNLVDSRVTNNHFVIAIDTDNLGKKQEEVTKYLKSQGALEVKTKEMQA